MLPVPYRVTSRTAETHDSVTLRLEPVGERAAPVPAGPVHDAGRPAASGRSPSRSAACRRPGDGQLVHTIRAVGAVSRALHGAPAGDRARRPRAVRHHLGPPVGRRARPGDRRGRGRAGPAAAGDPRRAGRAGRLPAGLPGRGRPHASRIPVPPGAGRLGRPPGPRGGADHRPALGRLGRPGRVRHRAAGPAPAGPGPHHRVPVRPRADDAVLRPGAAPQGARRPRTSGCRWNATCSAASACAGTASSGRSWSAGTARSSATPLAGPLLTIREL